MQKHIANVLSLSRIPLGLAIYHLEITGHFGLAFLVLLVGALTDAFDGWAARKYGTPTPQLGKDWIDPLSDGFMFAATALGLVHHLPNPAFVLTWVGIPFVALWSTLKWIKMQRSGTRLHRFANAGLPLAEWGGFWAFGLVLSTLHLHWLAGLAYVAVSWYAVPVVYRFKGFRVQAWLTGQP